MMSWPDVKLISQTNKQTNKQAMVPTYASNSDVYYIQIHNADSETRVLEVNLVLN